MLQVKCLDNSQKPNEIPNSRWLVKDSEYTITKVMRMKQQNQILGVKIEEINNDDLFPYTYFRFDRFGLTIDLINQLVEDNILEEEYV